MTRWWPYGLALVGLAAGLGGLLLSPSVTDEYLSLALQAAGLLLFCAGWIFGVARHASRISTRVPPLLLATIVVLIPVAVGLGGWSGWHAYQHHRQAQRLHAAERDLAALAIPAGLTPRLRANNCFVAPFSRCFHSSQTPLQLQTALIALLHGTVTHTCTQATRLPPCAVFVRGTVNGYPASASATPDLYFAADGTPPADATRIVRGGLRAFYVAGSNVNIILLGPPE